MFYYEQDSSDLDIHYHNVQDTAYALHVARLFVQVFAVLVLYNSEFF